MVDLVAAYSNRPELLRPLADVLRRVNLDQAEAEDKETEMKCRSQTARTRRRLAPADVKTMIELFQAGTPKTALSARFGISVSGVKWILRRHSVRRE